MHDDSLPHLAFISLRSYEQSAKAFLTQAQRQTLEDALESALVEAPMAGAVIRDSGGVRKIRVALPGREKSGGARVIYFYRGVAQRVDVLLVYPKNAKEDISAAERQAMKKLALILEGEP